MTLRFLDLGKSKLTGEAAVSQCVSFKEALRRVHPFIDNAFPTLDQAPDRSSCGIRLAYDPTDKAACAWVKRAEELAPEIWAKLAERRQGVGRV